MKQMSLISTAVLMALFGTGCVDLQHEQRNAVLTRPAVVEYSDGRQVVPAPDTPPAVTVAPVYVKKRVRFGFFSDLCGDGAVTYVGGGVVYGGAMQPYCAPPVSAGFGSGYNQRVIPSAPAFISGGGGYSPTEMRGMNRY